MSVLVIRNDDDCEEVYNRTTVFCYTRMTLPKLWEYVKSLELLADDRQALFFKIDFDIFSAPASMPDLDDWFILSIVLKAYTRPFSFGILVKLFYERFPLKMMVDFSTTNMFMCSGSLDKDAALSSFEFDAFIRLSNHHKQTFANSVAASKRFKEDAKTPSEVPAMLTQMAKKYQMQGGHWIMFFSKMEPAKREEAFIKTFEAAMDNWGHPISRFNAKISTDNFIICFGNKFTLASVDPTILDSNNKEKSVEQDPEPFALLAHIDELYGQNPTLFGQMGINYKPDIVSACCIQRDNFIRPTVYQARYGFYTANFRPVPPMQVPSPPRPSISPIPLPPQFEQMIQNEMPTSPNWRAQNPSSSNAPPDQIQQKHKCHRHTKHHHHKHK